MQYKKFLTAIKDSLSLSRQSVQETVIVPIKKQKKTDPWAKFKRKKNKKVEKPVGRHSQSYVLSNVAPSDYYPEALIKRRPKGWSLMLRAVYPDRQIDSSTQTLSILTDDVLTKTMPLIIKEPYRPPVSPAPYGASKLTKVA